MIIILGTLFTYSCVAFGGLLAVIGGTSGVLRCVRGQRVCVE